ncbi:MAG: hypothetical protein V4508_17375 [Pseudomonadota bacterium]
MEEDNASSVAPGAHVVGTKSWIAYAGTLVIAAILFFGLLPLAFMWNQIAAFVVLVASALWVGYRILLLRSVQLYYDEVGVWVYSGILPWKKGVTGVKWRDMDEATFVNGFWSWISHSYTVRIGHRFTKASEIVLTDIGGGKDAVSTLNTYQQQLIRSESIH